MNRFSEALNVLMGRGMAVSQAQLDVGDADADAQLWEGVIRAEAGVVHVGRLPYDEVASAELDGIAAELVAAGEIETWESAGATPSLRMDGPCPRCKHGFSQTSSLSLPVSSIRGSAKGAPPVLAAIADFLCECLEAHPGAPDGMPGCGASFTLVRPSGGKATRGR